MKKKELKQLAARIAVAEKKLQEGCSKEEERKQKNLILELSEKITSMEELVILDELVQEILDKQ